MVKLAQRGSQDPTDSSLQMKVPCEFILDQTISCYGKKKPNRTRPHPQSIRPQTLRKKLSHCKI